MRQARLAAAALVAAMGGWIPDNAPHLYRTATVAPSYAAADVQAMKYLGTTVTDKGVNFSVYSHNATRVDLLLFDAPSTLLPTRALTMTQLGDVWNLYVEGVGLGQFYGFRAWGSNWVVDPNWYPGSIYGFLADVDAQGSRFNPNKLLLDPYSRAVSGDHNWALASVASGSARTDCTYAAASKSVVVKSTYAWGPGEVTWRTNRQDPTWAGHRWQDAIIYETHPKGFTMSPASAVQHPGTFKGIAEKADYLKDLGITAVELMPVMMKPLDGGYWGYQTLLFFVPNYDFGVNDPDPVARIDEFKAMVEALHQRNIEVILDVVYNHTGEGGLWRDKLQVDGPSLAGSLFDQLANFDPKETAGIYSYRGLDNYSYYALAPDGNGEPNQFYWNNTGVGQETRPNNTPMRQIILDSLHFWSGEMHVDGFRFDLAPVLAEQDLNYNNNLLASNPAGTVVQAIIDDPLLQQYNTRLIAEPWSLSYFGLGHFPTASNGANDAWYEWNGNFRDWWRQFINETTTAFGTQTQSETGYWPLNKYNGSIEGGGSLTGSAPLFQSSGREPYHSVNFITIHDGFTLYDLLSYSQKQNLCGPLNQVCCDTPTSPFCDPNSGESNNHSRDWRCPDPNNPSAPNARFLGVSPYCATLPAPAGISDEPFKRQLMRNFFTALMVSQGTPLILGGDEWMRTQLGNNNAYSTSADNAFNWYDWGAWQADDARTRMHDFVRAVVQMRKDHGYAFAPATYAAGGAAFGWKDENGNPTPNWASKHVMMHFNTSAGPQVAVLINMEYGPVSFQLPPGNWSRLVDTQEYFDSDAYLSQQGTTVVSFNATLGAPVAVTTPAYQAQPYTVVVLQAQ